MKTVTASEMQALDQKAIRDYGIPSLLLMENAGRGVAELVFKTFKGKRVTIFCGKGNNGGDGLVVARHLANRGFDVYVLLFADPKCLKDDPAVNFQIISKMRIPLAFVLSEADPVDFFSCVERSDVVVDALFGVGLTKPVSGIYADAIQAINAGAQNVVSIDMPSGLDSDTGKVLGISVKAAMTATLAIPKRGLFQNEGPEYAGKICVVDIGIPKQVLADFGFSS